MDKNLMIVGVTGHIRVGKDTFFSLLQKTNPKFKRYSFADALKADLRGFLWEKCQIDINTATGGEKELIRPLMIAYGCLQRNLGDGLHWVRRVEQQILADVSVENIIPVITDFRFQNEVEYFKKKYVLNLVEVKRAMAPNPPDEEKVNQPLISKYVDYTINWPTVGEENFNALEKYVKDFAIEFDLV